MYFDAFGTSKWRQRSPNDGVQIRPDPVVFRQKIISFRKCHKACFERDGILVEVTGAGT